MTPDEMKVLARVANRNAIDNDSPVVVDDSRLIAPINNDSNELPLSLAGLDARLDIIESMQDAGIAKVNQLESALGSVLGANDSPVQVLAESLAQTRADVAELKSVSDAMRLTPADVISGVIKPIKLDGADSLLDTDFTTLNANSSDVAPYNETGVTTYKVRSLKNIGEKPKNLINLDGLEASSSVINRLSGEIKSINGFVRITSNNGITDVDLSNTIIPSVDYVPLSTDSLVTIEPQLVEFTSFIGGALTANRDIVVSSLDLGEPYVNGVTPPETFTEARYSFVQNATFEWVLKKYDPAGAAGSKWADASSTTEFTVSAIGANSCMVLFKNSQLVKIEYSASKYVFNQYTPVTPNVVGNFILINDPKNSAAKYIVSPGSVNGTISATNLQILTIQKPQTNNKYFRLNGKSKIVKCSATAGSVSADSSLIYYESGNAIFTQATGITSIFTKLADGQWLFNTSTKVIKRNQNSVSQILPVGYYNYDDKLVKINSTGKIVYDGEQGESINYRLPSSGTGQLNARVTVPTINDSATLTNMLDTSLSFLNITASDLHIDSQFNLKNSSGVSLENYNGLYWVSGLTGLTRANKLYRINSIGKCELYTGLAYLEIEPENNNGIRVWYSVSAGVSTQLRSDDYILTSNSQIIRVGIAAPASNNYGTAGANLINFTGTVAGVAAFSRIRDELVNVGGSSTATVGLVTDEQLSRMNAPTEANAYAIKYMTLGYMSGSNKATVSACIALGGVEALNTVDDGHFSNKFYRVLNGADFELVLVDLDGINAFAKYTDPLLKNSAIYLLNSTYYTVDTTANNKLSKVSSGWIFNDVDEQKDIRMIKSNGSLTSALDSNNDASCRHFAWNVNGVKTVYYAKGNASLDIVKCDNNAYPNFVLNASEQKTIMVFLIQIPAEAEAGDEEDVTDTSKLTMYRLRLADASLTSLVQPTAPNKQWKFLAGSAGQFDQYEFPRMYAAAAGMVVYWNISSSVNRPHVNRIVTDGSDYATDDYGLRSSTAFVNTGKFFTDPSNALLYGDSSTTRVKNNAESFSKYYIDYAGNLAKSSPVSGDRLNIVTDNSFVVFADNDNRSRYYSNGRMVLVTPGSLVAVSSKAAAQHADHAHNGLKMWGKDSTGMFNRWLNMQADVARQANNAFVGEVKDLIDVQSTSTTELNRSSITSQTLIASNTTAITTATFLKTNATDVKYGTATAGDNTTAGALTPVAIPDGLYTVGSGYNTLKLIGAAEDGTDFTLATGQILLILDGKVQDARAPRGTVIYTSSGIKLRTGYSAAQVAAAAALTPPINLTLGHTWSA
jgi:hypothetical protein